jgi:hypothetical protein
MGATSYTRSGRSTLGGMLEHDRLSLRALRLRSILTLLRDQAAKHSADENASVRARNAAITNYDNELARIRARLEQIR